MNLFLLESSADDQIATVAIPSQLTQGTLERDASRLRSWALIRGVNPAGRPFVRLHAGRLAMLHLPLARAFIPHWQTGLLASWQVAGATAHLADVTLPDLPAIAYQLASVLGPELALGAVEFHPTGNFARGEVVLPLDDPTDAPYVMEVLRAVIAAGPFSAASPNAAA